jgi:MFS family permease
MRNSNTDRTDTAPLGALGRDYRLLFAIRVLRSFGFGFIAVLLGLRLEQRGLGAAPLGVALSIGVLAASLYGLPAASLAARFGRRPVLAGLGLLMALSGADLGLATQPGLLLLAGATGMLGATGVDLGPFLAIEQAILVESVPKRARNRAFGRYSLTGGLGLSAGGLAASLGTNPDRVHQLFLLFGAIGILTAVISLMLSGQVDKVAPGPILSRPSIRPVVRLAGLFAVDALAGGLVLQAVIAYWLHVRFGAGSAILGPSFAAIALIQAGSYELASRLADQIGLVRTMVFTQLPSNVLLMLLPFSTNLAMALIVLLLLQHRPDGRPSPTGIRRLHRPARRADRGLGTNRYRPRAVTGSRASDRGTCNPIRGDWSAVFSGGTTQSRI